MAGSIKKITAYLFALRMLRMLLSVIVLIFSAKFFGVTVERDAWILASTFIVTLGGAVWGAINEVFRAKFIFIKEEEGEDVAVSRTSSLLGFVLIVTLFISLIVFLNSGNIASFMANNLQENGVCLFVSILVFLIPTFLINQLISLGISVLNAYEMYYIPEIIGVVTGTINLLVIVLLASQIGIYSLIVSQYIGLTLLLLAVVYYIRKKKIAIWHKCFCINIKHVKCFLIFALPFFFPYFIGQCNLLAEKWIAGLLGIGCVSSLDYARQFTVMLQGVLSSVLATVMVPMLAKSFSQKNMSLYTTILKENILVCFAIMGLFLPVLFGAARPLCAFFFLRGNMSVDAVETIISLVRLYSVSFVGVILYLIFGMALLASNKGKQYASWGVATQLLVLAVNLLLYTKLNISVFPFSLGLVHLLSALIMGSILQIHDKYTVYLTIARYVLVVAVEAVVLLIFNLYCPPFEPFVQIFLNLLILIVLSPIIGRFMGINIVAYIKKKIHNV